jgi:hypothetical protein
MLALFPTSVVAADHEIRVGVQPHSVVDNSDFSPTHLTFPLDDPYSTFSEGNGPSS